MGRSTQVSLGAAREARRTRTRKKRSRSAKEKTDWEERKREKNRQRREKVNHQERTSKGKPKKERTSKGKPKKERKVRRRRLKSPGGKTTRRAPKERIRRRETESQEKKK